jgi:hypothetical protein
MAPLQNYFHLEVIEQIVIRMACSHHLLIWGYDEMEIMEKYPLCVFPVIICLWSQLTRKLNYDHQS